MGFNKQEIYRKEGRDIIPVCSVHNKFQTERGRWLDKSEDFDNHIIYTKSQDASILESPCDECDDPKQIEIEFEEVEPEPKPDYEQTYKNVHKSGMFWEFYPKMTGEWEKDKEEFIEDCKRIEILINSYPFGLPGGFM